MLVAVKSVKQNYTPSEQLLDLLNDFRLMVNDCIRIGLKENVTSLKSLSLKAYRQLSNYQVPTKYRLCAISTAAGMLKNYRKASRKKPNIKTPYARRLMLTTCYGFKIEKEEDGDGWLRLSVRPRHYEYIQLNQHTKGVLSAGQGLTVRSVCLTTSTISISYSKQTNEIEPAGLLGIDRNLDNITVATSSGEDIRFDLSKATEIIDGIKGGAFEAGLVCASYYPGKLPLYTVLDLAMLTPDDIMAQARVQMAVAEHPAIAQEFKRWNLRMLLPGPLPQYQLMGKRRIARAEDLKGVRIRVSGEMARVLEDYGAVKSLVPAPETYTSLERGVVDMISFPSTYAFASYRLQEISKYFIDKISLGTQPCFWGVSETAWSKLSPAQQKLMLDLREPATQAGAQAYAAADAKNYADWKARGIEIIDFPAAERAKLTANAGKHWQEWVQDKEKKGLPGKALLEFVQAKIKEHTK